MSGESLHSLQRNTFQARWFYGLYEFMCMLDVNVNALLKQATTFSFERTES